MGLSTSKTKSKSDPYAPAVPAINAGLTQAQDVNAANQPRLEAISSSLSDAYNQMAPRAFGANSFVSAAQDSARAIGDGKYVGSNPGSSVYSSLMKPANDPSIAALTSLAGGSRSPGQYDGIGANNPALASLQAMSGDRSAAPSDQFYADTLGGKYLNGNPYLDGIVKSANDSSTRAVNSRFAAAGMGEGLSTPYAGVLGSALSDNENKLRYGAYNDELARMGQIAGQSDSMTNAGADRRLSATTSLGNLFDQNGQLQLGAQQAKDQAFNSDRSAQLAGATALGSQFTNGQRTQLDAAQSADSAYKSQTDQVLQALGLAPELDKAQYNGVAPALALAGGAASIPYAGSENYANILQALAGQYGTKTTTSTPSTFDQIMKGISLAGSLASGFGGMGGGMGGASGTGFG